MAHRPRCYFTRLARLAMIGALPLLAACAGPEANTGFDLIAFNTVPASDLEGRLRLPPGSDLNGPAYLVLTEGAADSPDARSEQFELTLEGGPFATTSGSIGLAYRLQPGDYRRYDRARRSLATRMVADESATISVLYRMCRRAGVPVEPPFVVGFLLLSQTGTPIYLAELPIPADIARGELPFCI